MEEKKQATEDVKKQSKETPKKKKGCGCGKKKKNL